MRKAKHAPKKKKTPAPVHDEGSVRISMDSYEIHSFGMVEGYDPAYQGDFVNTRTAELIPDDKFVTLRIRFELLRKPTECDDEPRRILWMTTIQKYLIAKQVNGLEVNVTSNNAAKEAIPHDLLINLMQLAHGSMRGAIAMLVRGTWLQAFTPNPQTMQDLMLDTLKTEKWIKAAERIFV